MTIESNTNTTIASELIFDRFHATYLIGYTLPTEESLHRIVVYLSSLNEEIPVSIDASVLSITLQGNVSQESTLQIIESTSTTTTINSKSAGSITVDTTGSINFASNVLISTVSIETSVLNTIPQGNFTQDSTLQTIESTSPTTTMDSKSAGSIIIVDTTSSISFASNILSTVSIETNILSSFILSTGAKKNIDSSSPISKTSNKCLNNDTCSTIFVIQPEQTNATSLATEPSSLPLNNSQVNYENVLVYVGIASLVLVMSLLACIMTLTTGILLYRRGRRKLKIENRNHRPTIAHPTLAITNPSYNEIAPEPRPRSAITSRCPPIQEERYTNIMMLDENLYEYLPLRPLRARGQGSNLSLDSELTDKETLSSHEVHPHDVELTNSELDLAKTLGRFDSSSVVESQL